MEIVEFLLPKNAMDWFFFGTILAWVGVTLLSVHLAKKDTSRIFTKPHFRNIKANVHDLSHAVRTRWDDVIDNGPGIALVLGLLGTFIGIGLAIQGGADILLQLGNNVSSAELTRAVGDLSPMLGDIGLKFKSSAWGVIAHIMLRFFIPFLGLEAVRLKAIREEMEKDAIEEKELHERNAKNLSSMLDVLKATLYSETTNKPSVSALLLTNNTLLTRVVDVQDRFGGNVDRLGKSVEDLERTIHSFRDEMEASIKQMNDGVGSAVHSIAVSVEDLKKGLAGELRNISRVASDLKTQSSEMTAVVKDQGTVLIDMGDKVQAIVASGARYAFSLEGVGETLSTEGKLYKAMEAILEESKKTRSEQIDRLDILIEKNEQIIKGFSGQFFSDRNK